MKATMEFLLNETDRTVKFDATKIRSLQWGTNLGSRALRSDSWDPMPRKIAMVQRMVAWNANI